MSVLAQRLGSCSIRSWRSSTSTGRAGPARRGAAGMADSRDLERPRFSAARHPDRLVAGLWIGDYSWWETRWCRSRNCPRVPTTTSSSAVTGARHRLRRNDSEDGLHEQALL